MKSFKYFDLNNNGTVEPDEFAKAIEKIGIMIPTKQVSLAALSYCFRTSTHFSPFTIPTEAVVFPIKSSLRCFTVDQTLLLRADLERELPRSSLRLCVKNFVPEEREDSSVYKDSSKLWTTTTRSRLINTNSQKLCPTTGLASQKEKSRSFSNTSTSTGVASLSSRSSSELFADP